MQKKYDAELDYILKELINEYENMYNNLKTIDPLNISLAGIVFINKGGYLNKKIQEEKEKNRIEKVETDLTKYTFLLMVFTAIVSLGTVISAWYFLLEIIEYYRHH